MIGRAKFALMQAVEAVSQASEPESPIQFVMTYDEFDIEAKLIYRGNPLQLPAAPPSAD